jgi:hypothetical protein
MLETVESKSKGERPVLSGSEKDDEGRGEEEGVQVMHV